MYSGLKKYYRFYIDKAASSKISGKLAKQQVLASIVNPDNSNFLSYTGSGIVVCDAYTSVSSCS
jgi:hypothetical protein